MLDHYIQREIVYQLAHATSLRFSVLQPEGVENKLFSYHLKKTIASGLVCKNAAGEYELTPEGKRVGKGSRDSARRFINRAYSLLLVAVREAKTDSWLLYTRPHQPYLGRVGFLQAQPEAGHTVLDVAHATLRRETGIATKLTVHTHGFMSLYTNDSLESYIHFTLLVGTVENVNSLPSDSPYEWQRSPDFHDASMLPTMPQLATEVLRPAGGFIDMTLKTP